MLKRALSIALVFAICLTAAAFAGTGGVLAAEAAAGGTNVYYFKIPLDYVNVNSVRNYAKFVFETTGGGTGTFEVYLTDWDGSDITSASAPSLSSKIGTVEVTGDGSYSVDIWSAVKEHLQAEQTNGTYVSNDEYISIALATSDGITIKSSKDAIVPITDKDFTEETETITSEAYHTQTEVWDEASSSYIEYNTTARTSIAKPYGAVVDITDTRLWWARNVAATEKVTEGDNSFVKVNLVTVNDWNQKLYWSNLFMGSGTDGALTADDVGRIYNIEFDTKYICEPGFELGSDKFLTIVGVPTGFTDWPESWSSKIHNWDDGLTWNEAGMYDQGYARRAMDNYVVGQQYITTDSTSADVHRKINVNDWSKIRFSWKVTADDLEAQPALGITIGNPKDLSSYDATNDDGSSKGYIDRSKFDGKSGIGMDNLLVEDITHAPKLEYMSASGDDNQCDNGVWIDDYNVVKYHKVLAEATVYQETPTVYGNSITNPQIKTLAEAGLPTDENIICSKDVTAVVTQGTAGNCFNYSDQPGVIVEGTNPVGTDPAEVKFLNMIKNKPLDSGDIGKVFKVTLKYKPWGYDGSKLKIGIRSLNNNLLDGGTVVNHPWACADKDYISITTLESGIHGTQKTIEGYFVVDDFMADPLYQIGCISVQVEKWGDKPSWMTNDSVNPGIAINSLEVTDTGWRVAADEALGYARGVDDIQKIDQFPSMGMSYTNTTDTVQEIFAASGVYRADKMENGSEGTATLTSYTVQPGETIIPYCKSLTQKLTDWGCVWPGDSTQKTKYMLWNKNTLEPLMAPAENMFFENRIPDYATRPASVEAAKTAARGA